MTVGTKLSGFVVVLVAVFGMAFLTGTQSAALLAPPEVHDNGLGGLSGSVDGYTLTAVEPALEPGADQFVELTLTGPDGGPVGPLVEVDAAAAHLVAVRRDLTGFQHITPAVGKGTSWWALLSLSPGPWRMVLEVQPQALGRPVTLGVDLTVRGDYRPQPLPPAADTVTFDGLRVERSGTLSTRPDSRTVVTVSAAGAPVTDLQPIHGAPGHAVIIRPEDLGLAHLHAAVGAPAGPRVEFEGGVPERGTYVVFVELQRADRLHVVAYTVPVRR